jgi:hypothetical protein
MINTGIFIVGLPRTGTKLLKNILERGSQNICITPENFFLGRFLRAGLKQKLHTYHSLQHDRDVANLVDDMFSHKFWGEYWDRLSDGSLKVGKEQIRKKILESDRTPRSLYEIILSVHVPDDDCIIGDKTGPNLYRVPTLLKWFPEGKIIHTCRDPRAIFASEHKKRLKQLSNRARKKGLKENESVAIRLQKRTVAVMVLLYITVASRWAFRLHVLYARKYPNNYRLSKFEDLVRRPEMSVRQLCRFLDIKFHPGMVHPPMVDSSFSDKNALGFNSETLNYWQRYMKPWQKIWFDLFCRRQLKTLNYL